MCTYSDSGAAALRWRRAAQHRDGVGGTEALGEAVGGGIRRVARARRVELAQEFFGEERPHVGGRVQERWTWRDGAARAPDSA